MPAQTLAEKFEEKKPMLVNGGLYAGGGVMLFGLTKGMYNVFTGFLSMTPADMGMYGLMAGFCTAGLMGTAGYIGSCRTKLSPEEVFQASLGVLRSDATTAEKLGGELGGHIEPLGLRAYRLDGGTVSLVDHKLAWVPPRIQMIFDLRGELHDALATVEAVKSDGQLGITFIGFEGK